MTKLERSLAFVVLLVVLVLVVPSLLGMGRRAERDSDGDGVLDAADNCTAIPNAGVLFCDIDGDGFGNVCDCDFDQDGRCWASDVAILTQLYGQTAVTPADMNCDGVVGGPDYGLYLQAFEGDTSRPAKPGPSGLAK